MNHKITVTVEGHPSPAKTALIQLFALVLRDEFDHILWDAGTPLSTEDVLTQLDSIKHDTMIEFVEKVRAPEFMPDSGPEQDVAPAYVPATPAKALPQHPSPVLPPAKHHRHR